MLYWQKAANPVASGTQMLLQHTVPEKSQYRPEPKQQVALAPPHCSGATTPVTSRTVSQWFPRQQGWPRLPHGTHALLEQPIPASQRAQRAPACPQASAAVPGRHWSSSEHQPPSQLFASQQVGR